MQLIRAIIRPEKATPVIRALFESGFPAVTKVNVYGRGKQRGLKVGEITYDELPKTMLMIVINDNDKKIVIETIIEAAKTQPEGQFGDGKVFVTPITEVWTISKGVQEL